MHESNDEAEKLALAKAFVGMDDTAGAYRLLNQLARHGNTEAGALLDALARAGSGAARPNAPIPAQADASPPPSALTVPDGADPQTWQRACEGDAEAAQRLAGEFLRAQNTAAALFWCRDADRPARSDSSGRFETNIRQLLHGCSVPAELAALPDAGRSTPLWISRGWRYREDRSGVLPGETDAVRPRLESARVSGRAIRDGAIRIVATPMAAVGVSRGDIVMTATGCRGERHVVGCLCKSGKCTLVAWNEHTREWAESFFADLRGAGADVTPDPDAGSRLLGISVEEGSGFRAVAAAPSDWDWEVGWAYADPSLDEPSARASGLPVPLRRPWPTEPDDWPDGSIDFELPAFRDQVPARARLRYAFARRMAPSEYQIVMPDPGQQGVSYGDRYVAESAGSGWPVAARRTAGHCGGEICVSIPPDDSGEHVVDWLQAARDWGRELTWRVMDAAAA